MRIDDFRREMPDWRWTAERDGFGWEYVGRKDGRGAVFVRAKVSLHDESSRMWARPYIAGQPIEEVPYGDWAARERAHSQDPASSKKGEP